MTDASPRFVLHFRKGDTVFRQGDTGREMYIIQKGRVAIYKIVEGERTTLSVLERGDFFGEMCLLEGLPRTATAEAAEDTDLIRIDGTTFNNMLRENVEIAVRMMRKLAVRLRQANERNDELMARLIGARSEVRISPEVVPSGARVVIQPEGRAVPLDRLVSLIGRRDPVTGVVPEVDLAEEAHGRSVSRRHAQIVCQRGSFYLLEEVGTLNGTFHNGEPVETGVMVPLKDGDEITVGMVKMTFQFGS